MQLYGGEDRRESFHRLDSDKKAPGCAAVHEEGDGGVAGRLGPKEEEEVGRAKM